MYKIILFFLLILYSCNYPDIDSFPEFNSLSITMEEALDKCRIDNIINDEKKDCFIEYKYLMDRF